MQTMPDKNQPGIDLEDIVASLSELRSAVKRNNPLLRTVATSMLYPILGLVYGTALTLYCLLAHNASIGGQNSLESVSALAVPILIVLLLTGGIAKIIVTKNITAKYDSKGFRLLLKAIYGGKSGVLIANAAIAILAGIVFLLRSGEPWYIVPVSAIFISFAAHSLDIMIDLLEYRVLGWSALVSGIFALFFIKNAAWLWTAAVFGSTFMIFGIVGIVRAYRRDRT
jgi:hypothetical protein